MGCEGESHFLGMPGGKKESTGVSEDGREDTDDGPSQEVPTGLVCVVVVVIDGAWHWYALVVVCVCGLPPCLLLAGSDSSSSSSNREREREEEEEGKKGAVASLSESLVPPEGTTVASSLGLSSSFFLCIFAGIRGTWSRPRDPPSRGEREMGRRRDRWEESFFFLCFISKRTSPPSFLSLVPSRTHLDQNKTKSL